MNTPIDDYKFLNKITSIKDIAYEKLFKNYIDLKLQGPDKLIEINSTDQESLIKSLNNGFADPNYRIEWNDYRNTILLTQGPDQLRKLETTIFKIVNL